MKHAVGKGCTWAAVGLTLMMAGCGSKSERTPVAAASIADDPRLTYPTPYTNVRPEVKYVGDKLCASCHQEQAQSFRHHPMGRSMTPSAGRGGSERLDAAARNPLTVDGFEFRVERRDGTVHHLETRRDPRGAVVSQMDAEVQYVVGSGEHGYSYLIEHDGYVFQSPLGWYTQKQAWDLAPGITADMHADRQIQAGCLFCHCNQVEPVLGSMNRYRTPVFHGFAIGCERCHGPGELHVARREAGEAFAGKDYTIVNPRDLPPVLRESICQQCHLSGEARVPRRGRQEFDFRPGLPLYLFASIFVRRPGSSDEHKSVNHVQQMMESTCYKASAGELGCTSCHDAHAMPPNDNKAAYFRDRCLKCHGKKGCSLPLSRVQKKKSDCTACHMPAFATSDIAHTAFTDHRIPRRPAVERAPDRPQETLRPGEVPIVHFHEVVLDLPQEETARDQGVALMILARRYPQAQQPLARLALPSLEEATRTWPDDAAAAEARAFALWLAGQTDQALEAYRALLTRHPQQESALLDAASLCAALRRSDDAIGYMQRAIQVDPWLARYHQQLAALLDEKERWPEALQECRAALRLNPFSPQARLLMVKCMLRTGDRPQAQTEFERLLGLGAPDPEKLRQWFARESR
jgi:tetratricopeptide (TPR) repeat protein